MQYKIEHASELSPRVFQKLIVMWLTIVFLTFTIALLMAAGNAKADVILPLPQAELAHESAILKSFSPSPAPALIQEKCASHLHPQKGHILNMNFNSRSQRNAENQGLQTIMAIKAYRQCASQIALEQLASK